MDIRILSNTQLKELIDSCYKSKRYRNILYDRYVYGFTYEKLFWKYTKDVDKYISEASKKAKIRQYKELTYRFQKKVDNI